MLLALAAVLIGAGSTVDWALRETDVAFDCAADVATDWGVADGGAGVLVRTIVSVHVGGTGVQVQVAVAGCRVWVGRAVALGVMGVLVVATVALGNVVLVATDVALGATAAVDGDGTALEHT